MDPVKKLSMRVATSSLRAVAAELGISVPYLHDVIRGKRAPGPKILTALGLTKKTVYQKAAP